MASIQTAIDLLRDLEMMSFFFSDMFGKLGKQKSMRTTADSALIPDETELRKHSTEEMTVRPRA